MIYGAISIFAASASNVMNLINVHKFIDLKPLQHYSFKPHLKSIGVFFAMSCATTIYLHLDTIMLKFMTTDSDVGYYGAATKIKTILVSIVTALGTVLLPRVSYYIKQNKMEEFRRITAKALNFVFLLAVPMTAYFIVFAREGIYFLSGSEYEGAVMPMRVIMPTLVLIGITNVLGLQILVPMGKEKYVLYSEIAGAVTDLILNALLIPSMKSTGASIGTLVAELVVLIVQYMALYREVNEVFKAIKYYKICIALICCMLSSVWVLKLQVGSLLKLLFSACISFSIYGLILYLLKEALTIELLNQISMKLFKRRHYDREKKD